MQKKGGERPKREKLTWRGALGRLTGRRVLLEYGRGLRVVMEEERGFRMLWVKMVRFCFLRCNRPPLPLKTITPVVGALEDAGYGLVQAERDRVKA